MNYWWLIAGGISLIAALIHLIVGHFDPISPRSPRLLCMPAGTFAP